LSQKKTHKPQKSASGGSKRAASKKNSKSAGKKRTPAEDSRKIIFDHFWAEMLRKQSIIGKQSEEIEKLFYRQLEERKRQLEESDKKFYRRLEERNLQMQESDIRFYRQLADARKKYYNKLDELKVSDISYGRNVRAINETGIKGVKGANRIPDKKGGRAGNLYEEFLCTGITKRFIELGFNFNDVAPGRKILDNNGNVITEIDILMENTKCIMAVETIVKPNKKDIENHINRLFILRDHRDKYHDRRKIHGAIMGESFAALEKQTIFEAGLFVIEQKDNKMNIDIPEGFIPREW
jgi:hypothetical protein